MAYDFKKEFKGLYTPKSTPTYVEVPAMTFVAVAGTGDPNEEDGAYARVLGLLYSFSYAVKMSKKGDWQPEGYFDYVVPPLEGLWWAGDGAFDGARVVDKSRLSWVSLVRQPDFVTPDVFARVCEILVSKKPELEEPLQGRELRLVRFSEGPCIQSLHTGPYDEEPLTVARIAAFASKEGLVEDIAEGGESPIGHASTHDFSPDRALEALDVDGRVPALRLHHEIYLSDPRRTAPAKLRTVIRHPVRASVRP